MARSLSNATRLAAALSETVSLTITRRGYAAASSAVMRRQNLQVEDKAAVMSKKKSIEGLVDSSSSSWVPDPVTGYYRPADCCTGNEVDPAELRKMLLSNRPSHL